MRTSYLDYAMSVIVARAIPDLRDGLKPVHRRILYAMQRGRQHLRQVRTASRRARSADTMGKYHPHGDAAIYDALVRMAQDFSMSLPLLDGQGNFGSMDGDKAAAFRYTEVRMAKVGGVSPRRHRQGHRRLPAELRRQGHGADGPAGALPEHAGERRGRHRRRHGDEHPAAQPRRGDRRDAGADREPRPLGRGADGVRPGAGLSHRRADPRAVGGAQGVPRGPRLGDPALEDADRGGQGRTGRRSSSRRSPTRSTRRR